MKRTMLFYLATLGLLGSTLFAIRAAEHRPDDALEVPLTSISDRLGAWVRSADLNVAERSQQRLKPTELLGRRYGRNGEELELFISYHAQQRAGESMHSPKNCLPGSGWEIWKQESATVVFEGRNVPVNLLSIQNTGYRLKVVYWYQSRQRVIASEYSAKLLLVRDALVDGRTAGSIVRVIVPDKPSSVANALEFAALLMPEVQRSIGH